MKNNHAWWWWKKIIWIIISIFKNQRNFYNILLMCVNLWQTKNLSKFKTTSKKTKLKNSLCWKKNEIIGCVKIVHKKRGLGFVVAKNSWNSTAISRKKIKINIFLKKVCVAKLENKRSSKLKKKTILHEKIEYYNRSSVYGCILLFLTFSRVLKLKY